MSPPGAFKPPGTVVRRRSEITEAKARVARLPRAAWLAKIQEAENWASAREAAVATVPDHGPPHLPPTIETELSITWKDDIWMPSGLNHWGEVHIHYTHRVARQADVSYVHLKVDRAIQGGTAIAYNHAIVAHAYANNLIDPSWTI
jgi:hypothetical protein